MASFAESLKFVKDDDRTANDINPSGSDGSGDMTEAMIRQMLGTADDLEKKLETKGKPTTGLNTQFVQPNAGFCVKTRSEDGRKIFINICHSDLIPQPPPRSDEEIAAAIVSGDGSRYSIPMSVGPPHAELDKKKEACTAVDVLINTDTMNELQERPGMKQFFLEVVFCHVETKNAMNLDRDFKILRQRKHVGRLEKHHCRVSPKKIQMVKQSGEPSHARNGIEVPDHVVHTEPEEGRPEYYVVEVNMPKVKRAAPLTLDVSEDRLSLLARPELYALELAFDYPVNTLEIGAQFNKKTKQLVVTLPVLAAA